jgi:hypothetical protein
MARGDHHVCSRAKELCGDASTDTFGSARDDDDATGEVERIAARVGHASLLDLHGGFGIRTPDDDRLPCHTES